MATMQERVQELDAKRDELEALFKKHERPDGTFDMTPEDLAEARARTDELKRLTGAWEQARELDEIARRTDELKTLTAGGEQEELGKIARKNDEELERLRRARELEDRELAVAAREKRLGRR